MGLFRRNASKSEADGPQVAADEPTPETASGDAVESAATDGGAPAKRGPYDAADVRTIGPRVDLGAIWLPVMPGLGLRMEIDKKTQKVTGVSATLGGSGLQVQAFAAPRTWGIWDEVRAELATSVTSQGGTVDDVPGPFGRELIARIPAKLPDGSPGVRPVRFIGVDGPRWFLRGVLTGQAAVDTEAAKALESVFGNVVVVRDDNPRPPRDLLALTMPNQGGPAAPPAGATPVTPGFDPLTRGPEITEIR
ncbi:hypothetical protein Xcel_1921 [Xylanimonas cellulosilytica DSM 15894]|uniref:DUF3710 domain-containing protein n=1 Tax=Xylanimonas cellulosilytica (strain DSM 15894 / JCM 12276 / CECT 5975 / KCTC 9989 / LMG 20990 / NBRC 107835 / XIL07) TaxID=446471 RepID=D1BT98_XYLCX|nr:DUF3710 domain-containing protein [Xylanimonas cellulosilytica]ACZ30940.1 hypothetical protein Xcel_1921 [Xylanimonas cellulosilytica DSM 15894]